MFVICLKMLGLKRPRWVAQRIPIPSPFMCVMALLLLFVIFMDDETLMKLYSTRAKTSVVPLVEDAAKGNDWVENKGVWKDVPKKREKQPPPPPPPPALTLPKEDIVNHIESLQKFRNMFGKDNGENIFADQYLTSLVNDDYRPIPLSKMHNNRLVLNPDNAQIPNVVNLIDFKSDLSDNFTFARYVTFKSVEKYIKPGMILFWGDNIPWGSEWWNRTVTEVPNIYYVYAPPVYELGNEVVEFIQHKSDWLRLDFLYRYGGIFLDNDVIVLRPFSDLMNFTMVMGQDKPNSMGTGVILSTNGTQFISKWRNLYDQYKPDVYTLNSNLVAYTLATTKYNGKPYFPNEILPGNFTDPYPKSNEKYILYCGHYDLQYNYAVHMYQEKEHSVPRDFNELKGYNCTLGDAMRIALYGDPKLLDTKNAKKDARC